MFFSFLGIGFLYHNAKRSKDAMSARLMSMRNDIAKDYSKIEEVQSLRETVIDVKAETNALHTKIDTGFINLSNQISNLSNTLIAKLGNK